MMVDQPGFFDLSGRLRELSAKGDDLERIASLVDFAQFRPELEQAVPRSDRSKGGRPAADLAAALAEESVDPARFVAVRPGQVWPSGASM